MILRSRILRLVAVAIDLLLNFPYESSADLFEPFPVNQAVPKGKTGIVMSCTSTDGVGFLSWSVYSVGASSSVNIAAGLSLAKSQDQYYAVNSSGNTVILTILSASETTAGVYTCSQGENDKDKKRAQLIVINSDPICTTNLTGLTELHYNQVVTMSCSISYYGNGSYVSANMVWSADTSTGMTTVNAPPKMETSGKLVTATSTITPSAGYVSPFPAYECTTSFQINPSSGMANNALTYKNVSRLFASPITVSYLNPANGSIITGATDGGIVYVGTQITCKVNANPPANYRWLDKTNATTINSPSIVIWRSGEYHCTAWNKAGNISASINLTVDIRGNSQTVTWTHSWTSLTKQDMTGLILGVVFGVLVVAALLALLIYLCCFWDKYKPAIIKYCPCCKGCIEVLDNCKKTSSQDDTPGKGTKDSVELTAAYRPEVKPNTLQSGNSTFPKEEGLIYAELAPEKNPLQLQKKKEGKKRNDANEDEFSSTYAAINKA